jgi:predicted GIY-YIG superfamily endonuclease
MTKRPGVYILASKRNSTLYIGVTSDLAKRAWQHKNDVIQGFTQKYAVHMLVYLRNAREYGRCHSKGKAAQEMEPWVEIAVD